MRFVFVMDTLDRVSHLKDTSFAFIRAAQRRGHESFHCLARDLYSAGGQVFASTHPIRIIDDAPYIELVRDQGKLQLPIADVDAVFIRTDPPFDQAYLYATLLLEQARGKTLIVNDPRGLRDANEKLYAMNFPEWTPNTIVTADRDQIHAFVARMGGVGVIKPLDGAGGSGVIQLRNDDKNARAIVDLLTAEGTRIAMVQSFLPEVSIGDKRVLLIDGEVIGAILRVPRGDDIRSNIHAGGSVVATELSPREQEMVRAIAPRLRKDGLFFVGLDVIGERLTEVNVTSPTGIQELSRFTGVDKAEVVIEWAERRSQELRGAAK